jgi:hypothetical protein
MRVCQFLSAVAALAAYYTVVKSIDPGWSAGYVV